MKGCGKTLIIMGGGGMLITYKNLELQLGIPKLYLGATGTTNFSQLGWSRDPEIPTGDRVVGDFDKILQFFVDSKIQSLRPNLRRQLDKRHPQR